MSSAAAAWGSSEDDRPRTEIRAEPVTPAPVAQGAGVFRGSTTATLHAAAPTDILHYTLDGKQPDASSARYEGPLEIAASSILRFRALRPAGFSPVVESVFRRVDPDVHVTLRSPADPQYRAGGADALIDGVRGRPDFRLGAWQGLRGIDLDADLDLGRPRELRHLSVGFLHDQDAWIFLPREVVYSLSLDGTTWRVAGTVTPELDPRTEAATIRELALEIAPARARYVRIRAKAIGDCPAWHKGAGNPAWLFADEIVVE
jgi:hypothetical protein